MQNDSAHNGTQYRGPLLPFSPSKHLTEDGVKVVCVRKVFLGSVSRPVMRRLLFVPFVSLESLTHVVLARGGFEAFNTNTPADLVSGYYRLQRSCEGYVFTCVCVCPQGGSASVHAGIPPPEQTRGPGIPPRADPLDQAPPRTRPPGRDGTHPTGMHSC